MEAIVLAGGLGTRLRSVVPDLPKPMAPIGGRPFLAWLLDDLERAGIQHAILAVGYRYEAIQDYFGTHYGSLALSYSIEQEPLGTGGAIRQAMACADGDNTLVLNGDTYLELDYTSMLSAHRLAGARITMAACHVGEVGRFGAMDLHEGRVVGFAEKGRVGAGYINGGVYILSQKIFDGAGLPDRFSFESDFLLPHLDQLRPLAFPVEGSFIDIGVPEDYARAELVMRGV
jgi:D-glycero-alpha-D-manno-heptose 1-phosphate guanylyltransferase